MAIVALRLKNVRACVKFLPWLAVVGAVVAGVVGRGIVLGQVFPTWIGAADLLFANACMIALIVATVALERGPGGFSPTRSGIAAWTATGLLLAAHTVALWTAATGSYTRCMSWPVWTAVEGDDPVLTVVRYALYLGAVVAIGLAVRGTIAHDRTVALTVAGLLVALLVLGPIIGFGQIAWLGFAYSILTVSIIAALVLLAARESLPAHQQDDNPLHPAVDPVGAGRP